MDTFSTFLEMQVWWFSSIRHNKVCNITADLCAETNHDVAPELWLQQLTGEVLSAHMSANRADQAQVDIAARGFSNSGKEPILI